MPLGIVSDTDFESELKNSTAPVIKDGKEFNFPIGRGKGSTEVPNSLRKIIGEEVITNGRQSALSIARDFGISPSSVSAYTKGATSTATINTDRPNDDTILKAKKKLSIKAKNRLNLALNQITEEKLEVAKLSEIAGVARDMSSIIKNMEPRAEDSNKNVFNGPSIILYAPQVRSQDDYKVVRANE